MAGFFIARNINTVITCDCLWLFEFFKGAWGRSDVGSVITSLQMRNFSFLICNRSNEKKRCQTKLNILKNLHKLWSYTAAKYRTSTGQVPLRFIGLPWTSLGEFFKWSYLNLFEFIWIYQKFIVNTVVICDNGPTDSQILTWKGVIIKK